MTERMDDAMTLRSRAKVTSGSRRYKQFTILAETEES